MTRNTKRHTKPCIYFQSNSCPLSSLECDYAHVVVSSDHLEELKAPQATLRTKPCKFFLKGVCKDGYWCRFKHPVKSPESSSSSSEGTAREGETGRGGDDEVDVRDVDPVWKVKPDHHPKYRTRPCRNYLLGKCAYGDRCSYLHSQPSSATPIALNSPSLYLPLTPPPSTYIPETPPHPPRVPCQTPVSQPRNSRIISQASSDTTDTDSYILSRNSSLRARTPSSSSYGTDEPVTPASPGSAPYIPTSSGLPALPISPLSDFACSTPAQMVSTPYGIYSPTSPVPMTIVHVPVAIPMYQRTLEVAGRASKAIASRGSRQRSQSHSHVPGRSNSHFKTKPCKFFNETGRCSKGDRCNFIHGSDSSVPSVSSSDDGHEYAEDKHRDSAETGIQRDEQPSSERGNTNFYKINWRVLGGGVMMSKGGDQRRHSEDASNSLSQRRPKFKDPFGPQRVICAMHPNCPHGRSCSFEHVLQNSRAYVPPDEMPSPLELGAPIDLKERSSSLPGVDLFRNASQISSSSDENALALNLQSYTFSASSSAADRPAIVVQNTLGPNERSGVLDLGTFDESPSRAHKKATTKRLRPSTKLELTVPSPPTLRARSSPSSPVRASLELPISLFSAESP